MDLNGPLDALALLHTELVQQIRHRPAGPTTTDDGLTDLEQIGYSVGFRLVEKLSGEHPPLHGQTQLHLIKFVCKVLWPNVFMKNPDSLQTDSAGIFVITDRSFKFLRHFTSAASPQLHHVAWFVVFTCGLIRGTLDNLNLSCVVTADIMAPPGVAFIIRTFRPDRSQLQQDLYSTTWMRKTPD